MVAKIAVLLPQGSSGGPVEETPMTLSSPTNAPALTEAPGFSPSSISDLGGTAITGWWTGCVLKTGANQMDACSTYTHENLDDPIYLTFEACYSNPYVFNRAITFLLQDQAGQAWIYNLIFSDVETWYLYRPLDCNPYGECSCTSSPSLANIRESIQNSGKCAEGDGYVCKSEFFIPFSSNCYVPAQLTVGNEVLCSMSASIYQLSLNGEEGPRAPGQRPQSESEIVSEGKGIPGWAIAIVVLVALYAVSFLFVRLFRRRKRMDEQGTDDGQDSVTSESSLWIKPGHLHIHDSRFTRRALNSTQEDGDGVWKGNTYSSSSPLWSRENINDLKFTEVS
jgi:hypothetical protein